MKEKQSDMENCEKEIADMGYHISECEKKLSLLEPENEELKATIEDVHEQMNKTVSEATENAEEEARFLKVCYFLSAINLGRVLLRFQM